MHIVAASEDKNFCPDAPVFSSVEEAFANALEVECQLFVVDEELFTPDARELLNALPSGVQLLVVSNSIENSTDRAPMIPKEALQFVAAQNAPASKQAPSHDFASHISIAELFERIGKEIKTPLSSVIGFLQLIREDIQEEELASCVDSALASSSGLFLFVEQLARLAESYQQGRKATLTPENPLEWLPDAIKYLKKLVAQHGYHLSVSTPESVDGPYLADWGKLELILGQALQDLLHVAETHSEIKLGMFLSDEDEFLSTLHFEIRYQGLHPFPDHEQIDLFEAMEIGGLPAGWGFGAELNAELIKIIGGKLIYQLEENHSLIRLDLPVNPYTIDL